MYGKEFVMRMQYIVLILRVFVIRKMIDVDDVEDILLQLVQLEEERFAVVFQENVEKQRQKVWHDKHIKRNHFEFGDLVLMYENNFFKHPRKLGTRWLGPYIVKEIIDARAVKLEKLDGTKVRCNKPKLKH